MSRKYGVVADEVDPRHRSSKDTKRWCKGKIGLEHVKAWVSDSPRWGAFPWNELLKCTGCGREFETRRKQWTIAEVVRSVREYKNWTQTDLATAAGMTQESISRIELGKDEVTIKTVRRLCEALQIPCSIDFHNVGNVWLNGSSGW